MLYKPRTSKFWWVKLKSGNRTYRKSTRTENKKRAQLVERELRDKLWAARSLDKGKTFGDAAIRWIDERQHKKSIHTDLAILEWFSPYLESKLLAEITRDVIEELRATKLKQASTETVNRHMALLRAILRVARDDWEWIEKIPKVPMYPKPKKTPRFLSPQEFTSLIAELPSHTQGPAWFAISTGLRAGPILSLRWTWISRDGVRFPPEVMKNNEWLTIPLSQTAWHVLAEQWGAHDDYVFTYRGQPFTEKFTTAAWRKATVRAKLPGVRFHDLRHTWASWRLQAGVPLDALQKLGGWSTYEAMQIYAHHSPASLGEWVD